MLRPFCSHQHVGHSRRALRPATLRRVVHAASPCGEHILHLLRNIPGGRLRLVRRTPCDMGLPLTEVERLRISLHVVAMLLRDGRLRSDGRCRTSWPRRPPHHAVSLRTVAIRVLASAAGPSGFIDRRTSWICLATRIYSSTSEGDTTLCLITSNRRHR